MDVVRTLLSDRVLHAQVHDSFPLAEAYRQQYFVSFLFYLGMITIQGPVRTSLALVVPNYVIDQMIRQTMSTLLEREADVEVNLDEADERLGGVAASGGWKAASLVFVGGEALYWRALGGDVVALQRQNQDGEA